MDKFVLSHIKELYERSFFNKKVEITPFYSEEEAFEIISYIKNHCKCPFDSTKINYFGGYPNAERIRIIFGEVSNIEVLDCVNAAIIRPHNRFFLGFQHREVLGSILGLGVKRELIADILISKPNAYIYLVPEAFSLISPLEKISNELVSIEPLDINDVPKITKSEIRSITIPSLRLDVLLAHVFGISRETAKEEITKGNVKAHQEVIYKNDYEPKEREKISLRGHGKFKFLNQKGVSKKGKLLIEIEIYL